jgi:hypothetical protein
MYVLPFFLFEKYILYSHENIYNRKTINQKGIYNETYILFLGATKTKIKPEYASTSRDLASLMRKNT